VVPLGAQSPAPPPVRRELQARLAEMDDVDADVDYVVEPRRLQVAQRRLADDERDAVAAELLLAEAEAAQPLRARALEVLEVVRVEDDPRGVGVFPVDANRHAERGVGRGRRHRRRSGARSGLPLLVDRAPDRMAGLGLVEREAAVGLAREAELGLAVGEPAGGAVQESQARVALGAV